MTGDGASHASPSCSTVTAISMGLCISVRALCSSGVGLLEPPVGTVTAVEANTGLPKITRHLENECFIPTLEGVISCDNLYRKIKTDRIEKRARMIE